MKLSHKITALLAACAMLLPLTGCGKSPLYYRYDYDLSEYITLGEYKNLPVTVSEINITEEVLTCNASILAKGVYHLSCDDLGIALKIFGIHLCYSEIVAEGIPESLKLYAVDICHFCRKILKNVNYGLQVPQGE